MFKIHLRKLLLINDIVLKLYLRNRKGPNMFIEFSKSIKQGKQKISMQNAFSVVFSSRQESVFYFRYQIYFRSHQRKHQETIYYVFLFLEVLFHCKIIKEGISTFPSKSQVQFCRPRNREYILNKSNDYEEVQNIITGNTACHSCYGILLNSCGTM